MTGSHRPAATITAMVFTALVGALGAPPVTAQDWQGAGTYKLGTAVQDVNIREYPGAVSMGLIGPGTEVVIVNAPASNGYVFARIRSSTNHTTDPADDYGINVCAYVPFRLEAWAPGSYYLAYRAYDAQTGQAVTQQRAANLTATVARNARVTLDATIAPLRPGTYFLDFTMVKTGGVVFTDQLVPPGRIVLRVFDIPPVVQELHPPNGYQAPTLTPLLWARALDIDAPPGSTLRFRFEVCEQNPAGAPVNCFDSGYLTSTAWTVPIGRLFWGRTYLWRAFVKGSAMSASRLGKARGSVHCGTQGKQCDLEF